MQFVKEFQVIIIHVLWNLCEKQFQILIGVNLIGLGCFYEAVKHGAGFCTIVGFHENEVLSADGKRTDSLFRIVVIGWNHSVIQEYTKVFFLIDAVSESFPDSAVMCDLTVLLFYPFEISVNLLLSELDRSSNLLSA